MSKGQLTLPARKWKNGDAVRLKIYRDDHTAADSLVDEYLLVVGQRTIVPWKRKGKPRISGKPAAKSSFPAMISA